MLESLKKYFKGYEHVYFTTSDGARLSTFHHAGSGVPLILIPGWSGNAVGYSLNLQALAKEHEVYILEHRGHGYSQTPPSGYRLSRLAMDLHEFFLSLHVPKASMLGHSMGCSVLWCYIDLFGTSDIEKLILGDEPPMLFANPEDTEEEIQRYGGQHFDLWQFVNAYARRGWDEGGAAFNRYFCGELYPEPVFEEREEIMKETLAIRKTMDSKFMGMLLLDHITQDWRDTIPRIDVPALYMSGDHSHATTYASAKWVVDAIKGCQWVRFSEEEGGTHSFFINCPEKANRAILDFLKG